MLPLGQLVGSDLSVIADIFELSKFSPRIPDIKSRHFLCGSVKGFVLRDGNAYINRCKTPRVTNALVDIKLQRSDEKIHNFLWFQCQQNMVKSRLDE